MGLAATSLMALLSHLESPWPDLVTFMAPLPSRVEPPIMGEDRRMDERASGQFDGYQASRAGVNLKTLTMRIMRKGAPLPAPEEPIPVNKLQGISRKHSPPTRRLGRKTKKVDLCELTRKSISVGQIAKVTKVTDQPSQDWFHTLPSGSISSFKELAYVFTKEYTGTFLTYTSYRTIKENPSHIFNLRKKPEESLQDYIKRFNAEKANIVGCDNQIASSAFKKGLPAEHDLYRKLTITLSQTLAEVFTTAERYALWDDARIAAKKSTK
ncbi:unnamed protein product, partial [Prunus brigantina]